MKNLQSQTIPNDHVDDYLNDKSPVTPINIDYLDKELSNHPNALFRNNLSRGFRDGFLIGFEGPHIPRFSHNLKSASEHPVIVSKNILKEVSLARRTDLFLTPFR